MDLISHAELLEILHYDPATGVFTWKADIPKGRWVKAGQVAGRMSHGYREIGIYGQDYLAHRLAWFYVHGVWPKQLIDHANRVRSDNRIDNLREASFRDNQGNQGRNRRNKTGFKGVNYRACKGKWRATIAENGKQKHLGYFDDPEKAHQAYVAAAKQSFGQFARGA